MPAPYADITSVKILVLEIRNQHNSDDIIGLLRALPTPLTEMITHFDAFLKVLKALSPYDSAQREYLELLYDGIETLLVNPRNFLTALSFVDHHNALFFVNSANNLLIEVAKNNEYLETFTLVYPLLARKHLTNATNHAMVTLYAHGDHALLSETWLAINSSTTSLLTKSASHLVAADKADLVGVENQKYSNGDFESCCIIFSKLPTVQTQNIYLTAIASDILDHYDTKTKEDQHAFDDLFRLAKVLKSAALFLSVLKFLATPIASLLSKQNVKSFVANFPQELIPFVATDLLEVSAALTHKDFKDELVGTWAQRKNMKILNSAEIATASELIDEFESWQPAYKYDAADFIRVLRALAHKIFTMVTNFDDFIKIVDAIASDHGKRYFLEIIAQRIPTLLNTKENFVCAWQSLRQFNVNHLALLRASGDTFIAVAKDRDTWNRIVEVYLNSTSYNDLLSGAPAQMAMLLMQNNRLQYFNHGMQKMVDITSSHLFDENVFTLYHAIAQRLKTLQELISVLKAVSHLKHLTVLFVNLQPTLRTLSCTAQEKEQLLALVDKEYHHFLADIKIIAPALIVSAEKQPYTTETFLTELKSKPSEQAYEFVTSHAVEVLKLFPAEFMARQVRQLLGDEDKKKFDQWYKKQATLALGHSGNFTFWKARDGKQSGGKEVQLHRSATKSV